MAYPDSKETWVSKVDRNLSIGEVGSRITKEWFNNWQDFLERLQDILGLGIKGGFATLKAWLDNIVSRIIALEGNIPQAYYDRGDPSDWDYYGASITDDMAWHDLNISSKIPVGTKLVHIRMVIQNSSASMEFAIRKNGNTQEMNCVTATTQVAGRIKFLDVFIVPDTNRIIEYRLSTGGWTKKAITIAGWWK